MTFLNVRFPLNISYGSRFGPSFNTGIAELDSGHEVRSQRWSQARRIFNLTKAIQDPDKISTVLDFFHVVDGNSHSFRVRDWSDYTTASNHRAAHAFDDQVIGTGDGTNKQFQLQKTYNYSGFTHVRNLTKPVLATTKIGLGGVEQVSGFTVNDTTGKVDFTTAPGNGVQVTAGAEFDCHARFDLPTPERLPVEIEGFNFYSIRDLPMKEVLSEEPVTLRRYAGGVRRHALLTANVSITNAQGLCHAFEPTVGSLDIVLPSADDLPAGGHPWFVLFNEGPNAMAVKTTAGTSVISSLGSNEIGLLFISVDNLGNKTWIGFGAAGG